MRISLPGTAFFLSLTLAVSLPPALAQGLPEADEADSSSQQVEESDEEFRRRMELEDARARELGYPTPADSQPQDLEKIDKLPEKSRDNIRDQLIDVIVENGEWEPFDALREYPYAPTAEAQAEPGLLQEEQEAWEEQIKKYHEREAAAYGAARGPVPGPGNPSGQEGGGQEGGEPAAEAGSEQGAGGQTGEQAGAQAGEEGSGQGEAGDGQTGSSGTYQPYESNRSPAENEVSTAGAQQSALDFLRGQQGEAQPTPSAAPSAAGAAAAQAGAAQTESAGEPTPGSAAEAETEVSLDTRGIIALEDLDKLEGAAPPAESTPPAEPEDSEQR